MAIGTGLAIAAGVGALGSVVGGVTQASAAKKAAKTAASTTADSNALQQQIYASNKSVLEPYTMRGNAAGAQINALLGLGGDAGDYAGYVRANADLMSEYQRDFAGKPGGQYSNISDYGRYHYDNYGQAEGRQVPTAFDAFKNSTGYQAQQDAANKAVNVGYAARGGLESGAAQKALQGNASVLAGNYFQNYLGALQGQQAVGAGSASALAGVGQNYAGAVGANNQAGATAQINAGLAGAQGWTNALGGIANAAGTVFGQSSYGNSPSTIQTNLWGR